jgi:ssDNA-binding Zn-finger/Zn-ribbon topoisomerase 1
MSSVHPNPIFSRAEIGILPCSKCGKPMRLARVEPAAPGYDVRIFECPECNTTGSFSVAI